MRTLGITGPIGHGKSTFAEAILQTEPNSTLVESSMVISEVADFLNRDLRTMPALPQGDSLLKLKRWLDTALPTAIVLSTSQEFDPVALEIQPYDTIAHPENYEKLTTYLARLRVQPDLLEYDITPESKESYRPFLQWIGGYVTTKLGYSLWYEELVERGREAEKGGCDLYLVSGLRFPDDATVLRRTGAKICSITWPGKPEPDKEDPSEVLRKQIPVDFGIINDGAPDNLSRLATVVAQDLRKDTLLPVYQARIY